MLHAAPAMRERAARAAALPTVPELPAVGLLSLPDAVLVRILRLAAPRHADSRLLFVVPLVCRRLAAVARLPSELWSEQLITLHRCGPYGPAPRRPSRPVGLRPGAASVGVRAPLCARVLSAPAAKCRWCQHRDASWCLWEGRLAPRLA